MSSCLKKLNMLLNYKSTIIKAFLVIFLATNIDSTSHDSNGSMSIPEVDDEFLETVRVRGTPRALECIRNINEVYKAHRIQSFQLDFNNCMFLGFFALTRTMMNEKNDYARWYYNYLGDAIIKTDELQSPEDWCKSNKSYLLYFHSGTDEDAMIVCQEQLEQTYGKSSDEAVKKAYFEVSSHYSDSLIQQSYHNHIYVNYKVTRDLSVPRPNTDTDLYGPQDFCEYYHSGTDQ